MEDENMKFDKKRQQRLHEQIKLIQSDEQLEMEKEIDKKQRDLDKAPHFTCGCGFKCWTEIQLDKHMMQKHEIEVINSLCEQGFCSCKRKEVPEKDAWGYLCECKCHPKG